MAAGTRTVKIKFDGSTRGLDRAASRGRRAMAKLGRGIATVAKGIAIGAAAAVVGIGLAIAGGVKSLMRIEKIGAQTNAVIKSTGGAANVTRKQIDALAGSLEAMSGVEAETITEGQNLLLTFTNIQNRVGKGNDIFDRATRVMTDMSVALGQDMKSSSIQLGKALNDPIKGVTALQRVGVSFTAKQKAMIKKLVESGDVLGAQKIILAELNKEFGGSAKALGETMPGKIARFKHALGTLQEEIAGALMPALTGLTDWAVETGIPALEKLGKTITTKIKGAAKDLFGDMSWADTFENLREIWDRWVADFKELKEAADPLIEAFKEWAGPIIRDGINDLRDAWADMQEALKDPQVRAGLKSLAIVLGVIVVAAVALMIASFRGAAWIVKNVLVPVFKLLAKVAAVQMNFVLNTIELFLTVLRSVIDIAAKIPGPHQAAMRKMSAAIGGAIDKVKGLRDAINGVPTSKKVNIRFTNRQQFLAHIREMRKALRGLTNQGVRVSGVTGRGGFSERAHGGPVAAGRSYLVGERGPELLTMGGASGHITPNHQLAAGGPDEFVAEATIDLGEGISRVVEIKFRRKFRELKRGALAGAGALA